MAKKSFLELAQPLALKYGFRMIPVPATGKGPVWTGWPELATNTEAGLSELQQKAERDPRFTEWNAGCVADPLIHCALDCDDLALPARIENETGEKLPVTLTVRSGGKGAPHYYFLPTALSTHVGNRSTGVFDFWVSKRQTVAPGSTHASGRTYDIIVDAPLATIPDWLCNWIAKQESIWRGKNAAGDESAIGRLGTAYKMNLNPEDMFELTGLEITSGQHPTMLYVAGLLHDGERTPLEIASILTRLWGTYCSGRQLGENDDEMMRIARHVVKGEPANLEPQDLPTYVVGTVLFDTEKAMREYLQLRAAGNNEARTMINPYPVNVWNNTLYGKFAEDCGRGNFVPREFWIEAIKTVAGAILGRNLCIAGMDGGKPRFDTILIGPPACGKNTSIEWAQRVFKSDERALFGPPDSPLHRWIWSAQEDSSENGLGACITRISSASGLARFVPSTTKKSNVPQDRILLSYTEMAELLEKITIDGSGASLVGALCDLYDSEEFIIPALKEQKPFGGTMRMSLLGGVQPDRWNELAGGKGIEYSGIHSRWNLIPAPELLGSAASLSRPDFTGLAESFAKLFPVKPRELTVDANAHSTMRDWYADLMSRANEANIGDQTARLNILAWRNALHQAWINDAGTIRREHIERAVALSDYQFVVRGQYSPLVGDDRSAKYIEKIRRFVERKGTVTWKQLRDGVNYRRMGQMFDNSVKYLLDTKEIELADKAFVWKGEAK